MDDDEYTALHFVCYLDYDGHIENTEDLIKFLIDCGADVNFVDAVGNTPIFYACESENLGYVKLLIDAGANVNHQNNRGDTILHNTIKYINEPDKNILSMLIQAGASIYIKDKNGHTVLDGHREELKNFLIKEQGDYESMQIKMPDE